MNPCESCESCNSYESSLPGNDSLWTMTINARSDGESRQRYWMEITNRDLPEGDLSAFHFLGTAESEVKEVS